MPRVRRALEGLLEGKTLVVVFHYEPPIAEGKYVLGNHLITDNIVALVFDGSMTSHRELTNRYNLRPWGGGWLCLDTTRRTIRITGASQDYGSEPDRTLTLRAIKRAFPDYEVSEL